MAATWNRPAAFLLAHRQPPAEDLWDFATAPSDPRLTWPRRIGPLLVQPDGRTLPDLKMGTIERRYLVDLARAYPFPGPDWTVEDAVRVGYHSSYHRTCIWRLRQKLRPLGIDLLYLRGGFYRLEVTE